MISKINSTAFKGKIVLSAREKDSLFESCTELDTRDIKKIRDYGAFTTIQMNKGKGTFVQNEVPYKKLMQAYRLAKDTNVTISFNA